MIAELHPNPISTTNPNVPNSTKRETRWRPSKAQLTFLRTHFTKNKYPTIEEKEAILSDLNERFKVNLTLSQLTNWFQKERIKMRKSATNNKKATKIYRKLSKSEIDHLTTCFEKNKYPRIEEMVQIAQKLGVKLIKVENWFKHNRRNLAKEGQLSLQQRNYFDKEELNYVQKMFQINPIPTKKEISDIAQHLKCSEAQVKNWFANQKKKIRTQKAQSNIKEEPQIPVKIECVKKISQVEKEEALSSLTSVSTLASEASKESKLTIHAPLTMTDNKKNKNVKNPLNVKQDDNDVNNVLMHHPYKRTFDVSNPLAGVKRPMDLAMPDHMQEYYNMNENMMAMSPNTQMMYQQMALQHGMMPPVQNMDYLPYKKMHAENLPHNLNMPYGYPGLPSGMHPFYFNHGVNQPMMPNLYAGSGLPGFPPSMSALQGKLSPTHVSMMNYQMNPQAMGMMPSLGMRPMNYMNFNM